MKPSLSESDFQRAAANLRCSVAAIRAVCQVEAPRGGFLPDDRPTILFERHVFSRLTSRKFDGKYPNISSTSPGGYGKEGAYQHDRLEIAAALDRNAALQSASWGKFQIMGFNYASAGHATLQSFINAMYTSEGAQLDAFVAFVKSQRLDSSLRMLHWADFASGYNGPNYRINKYDEKLDAAYKLFA